MMHWSSSSNLGDCLFHLNFLLKMGGEHTMWVKPEYLEQLNELSEGTLVTFGNVWERPPNTIDFWMANAMLEPYGVYFRNQEDSVGFLQVWFNHMGGHVKHPRPVYHKREDMIWDCPAIDQADVREVEYDVLLINSQPTSGQCPGYSQEEVDALGQELRENGLYVLFANWEGHTPYSITELGKLAQGARVIIGTANGPLWPTFNEKTKNKDRIIFLSPMFLDYGLPGRTFHAENAEQARRWCVKLALLK